MTLYRYRGESEVESSLWRLYMYRSTQIIWRSERFQLGTSDRPSRRAQRGEANLAVGASDRPIRPAGGAAVRPDSALPPD